MQFFRKNKKRLRDNFYIKLPIKKNYLNIPSSSFTCRNHVYVGTPHRAPKKNHLDMMFEHIMHQTGHDHMWSNHECYIHYIQITKPIYFFKKKYKKFVFITFTKHNLIFSGQKEYMIIILFRVKKYLLKLRTIFEIIIIH